MPERGGKKIYIICHLLIIEAHPREYSERAGGRPPAASTHTVFSPGGSALRDDILISGAFAALRPCI